MEETQFLVPFAPGVSVAVGAVASGYRRAGCGKDYQFAVGAIRVPFRNSARTVRKCDHGVLLVAVVDSVGGF